LYDSFIEKKKLLALIKNVLEVYLQNEKDPFSSDTLLQLKDLAKNAYE
jgi:hypothetical protein